MPSRSPKRSSRPKPEAPASASGWGPTRVAEFANRRPKRVLAVWGVVVLVSMGLVGTLLGSGLTSDSSLTNHPESERAQQLIDQRLPGQDPVDEIIVVRSERLAVADAAFAARVRSLTRAIRANGGVTQTLTYLDPGGRILVSGDRHAAALTVTLDHTGADRIDGLIAVVEGADGKGGFAAHITGDHTLDRDFTELSSSDLRTGELQFRLPAALVVLLLVVGTLVGAAIPMMMAILSIVVALGVTAVIGQVFELNLFIVNMIVAMGLALGIDYSLFF